jgi:hypothetical protein
MLRLPVAAGRLHGGPTMANSATARSAPECKTSGETRRGGAIVVAPNNGEIVASVWPHVRW